jgi:hypothetical protein
MKLVEVFSKRNFVKPVNVALVAAVGILMGILVMAIFRVS